MRRKLVLTILLAALLILCLLPASTEGDITLGVKEGDWIEFHVVTTGNPPEEHNVTWARIEIIHIEDSEIRLNSTSQARNGTVSSLNITLNVAKGQIGAWWIIPGNLGPGDMFYDDFLKSNITIEGEQQLEYAGAIRDITNTTYPTRLKRWDKATGVFVQSTELLEDYTINVTAMATNMWGPQAEGLGSAVLYALVFVVVIAVIVVVAFAVLRRRKKQYET